MRPPLTAVNPVLPGFHPDPSVCRLGNDFYVVTSSFGYVPGLPVFHSTDLATWRQVGHALDGPSGIPRSGLDPSDGIYAPTLRAHDGTLHLAATDTTRYGNFVMSTRDPAQGWGPPVRVDRTGIDPGLAFTDDGRVLMATTATGGGVAADPSRTEHAVLIGEIDLATGARIGPVTELTRGWCGRFPEGPRFVRRGRWWYLILAEGGTEAGHMVTVARAARPEGPYEPAPHNPVLSHRSRTSPFQCVGHADLVEAGDGSWWAVCLGTRPQGHPAVAPLGRETFLLPVRWTDDDWPVFGSDGLVPESVTLPWAGERAPRFVSETWCFLGEPARAACRELPDGGIRLSGRDALPEDGPACSMALRRLPAPDFTLGAHLRPGPEAEESGLVIWEDPRHHYRLALQGGKGNRSVELHRRIGDVRDRTSEQIRVEDDARLEVRCRDGRLTFVVGASDGRERVVGTADIRYLAPEVAGGFTGVLAGAYTAGPEGAVCDFERFTLSEGTPRTATATAEEGKR
ncbi:MULTISPECIES: family 43 glycosylhydrolase [unclassified Streptomyces]|uniref:glycoside hydrolase family 43 protein n=1 Tax=unclassified Streptomyces TaxID=2593676 RepID=UPI0035E339B9